MNRKLRKTVIAGNWKMNMLASQVEPFAKELLPKIEGFEKWCDGVICAPAVLISAAVDAFKDSNLAVGAQNVSQFESGAYTGEISASQLLDIGAHYVIIGHSERREYYGETDSFVNLKVHAAIKSGLTPIVCVGESLHQRELGVTNDHIAMQVKTALYGVIDADISKVIIAYEPIWAIGTGKTATPEDAQAVCAFIRSVLSDLYSPSKASSITIQYGGSMNEKNAYELLSEPDIDGGLIGGASLKPDTFAAIINAANQ